MASESPKFTLELPQLQPNRLLQRRKLLGGIAAGFGAVATILVLALYLVPQTLEARQRVTKNNQSLSATNQRVALVTGLTPADRENFVRVAQVLPQSKEPLVILQALNDIATEASVSLGKFETTPGLVSTASAVANRANTANQVQKLDISIEMSGTFQQINRALELVESAAPLMEVTELSLAPLQRSSETQGDANIRYTAKLLVTSYFLPPPPGGRGNQTAKALTATQQETLAVITPWRNRLPANATTPAVFSRTNLFILEVTPTFPDIQSQTEESSPSATPETSTDPTGSGSLTL